MLRINHFHGMILSVLALASLPLGAQTNVAVVNLQAAILGTAEVQKAQTDMQNEFRPRQEEIQKLQKELQDIQDQLQKMAGKLTPQAEQDLRIQGQRKQRDLQRKTEDLQADLEYRRNEILTRVGRQMQQVIQKLAQEKNIDIVIDVSNIVYAKPALDLTKEATAAYDKAYPVQ